MNKQNMMMMGLLLPMLAAAQTVKSPNGNVTVTFSLPRRFCVAFVMVMAFCLCGCSNRDETAKNVGLKEVSISGCKSYVPVSAQTKSSGAVGLEKEYIELKGTNNGDLCVFHANSLYSCEPGVLKVTAHNQDGKIVITEEEGTHLTNCVCYYDLSYVVSNLELGQKYDVEIRQGKRMVLETSFIFSASLSENIQVGESY